MDAALASLRSAMESLLEEKLTAALAEMEALQTETVRLKVEQQALATETSELRIENQVLQGELKEIRLRLGGVEAASTAPGSPPRAESPSSPSSEKNSEAAEKASIRLPLSLRKAWYVGAVQRVLALEAEKAQMDSAPTGLKEALESLEAEASKETEVKATSVVHLRAEPSEESRKNGSKLYDGEMAWSDAQVQAQGVTFYRLQSGWAPLLRQKGQDILEEVVWDTDWRKASGRGRDLKGEAGYGGCNLQKQAWAWKDEDRYGRAGRARDWAWGNRHISLVDVTTSYFIRSCAEEVKAITMTQELPGVQPPVAQAAAAALRPMTSVPAPPLPGMAGALRPPMHGVAPCMAPFAGVAMPAVPMLHGYQKQVLAGLQHTGVQTPETVPVGVLASMLAGVSQAQGGRLVRYKPLDPAMTPQALPAMEVPTPQLLAKVEEFYEDLQDEDRRSSSSSSSSRSRSR
ncbi:unnamed protein product, partial [Symbiodinium microadriaticum]